MNIIFLMTHVMVYLFSSFRPKFPFKNREEKRIFGFGIGEKYGGPHVPLYPSPYVPSSCLLHRGYF